jgi:cysteine synthase A
MDVLVSGVGTGGTISDVSLYFKKTRGKPIVSVAIEPVHSPVMTQKLNNEPLKPGPHKIQGIGAASSRTRPICLSTLSPLLSCGKATR